MIHPALFSQVTHPTWPSWSWTRVAWQRWSTISPRRDRIGLWKGWTLAHHFQENWRYWKLFSDVDGSFFLITWRCFCGLTPFWWSFSTTMGGKTDFRKPRCWKLWLESNFQLAWWLAHNKGLPVPLLLRAMSQARGNNRLPGIMTLGYIAASGSPNRCRCWKVDAQGAGWSFGIPGKSCLLIYSSNIFLLPKDEIISPPWQRTHLFSGARVSSTNPTHSIAGFRGSLKPWLWLWWCLALTAGGLEITWFGCRHLKTWKRSKQDLQEIKTMVERRW